MCSSSACVSGAPVVVFTDKTMSCSEKREDFETSPLINLEEINRSSCGNSRCNEDNESSSEHQRSTHTDSSPGPTSNRDMSESNKPVAMTTPVRAMDTHRSLHQLAREGDIDTLRQKLANKNFTYSLKKLSITKQRQRQERAYLQRLDNELLTPLHYAARYGRLCVVLLLLKKGACVNVRGKDDLTPLHMAARHCHLSTGSETTTVDLSKDSDDPETIISVLINAGADVNARDRYGMTPLHYSAMRANHMATTELLHCPDINVKARDQQQMTPLLTACTYGHVTICHLLIAAGASLSACDEQQQNCLHTAAKSGYPNVLRLLLEAVEDSSSSQVKHNLISAVDEHNNTPLLLAVASGHPDSVTILLQHGADINIADDEENSPLHIAVTIGGGKIADLLIQKGASVNLCDSYLQTPLHRAASYNRCEIIPALLARGARLECRDVNHCTPLLLAAAGGHEEAVKLLLERGANVTSNDRHERNALHYCAEHNHVRVLKVLLENSLVSELIDSVDIRGASPLHCAAQFGNVIVVGALVDAGADIDLKNEDEEGVLHVAAKYGKADVVAEVLSRDPMSVNDQDEQQNTPLHVAALNGHVTVVRQLVAAGAAIVAQNCHHWSPLDCAAVKGWVQTVKVLLESGSPVDTLDKSKTTPLQLAAREGHPQVAQKLLEAGAMAQAKNDRGRNALEMAIIHGNRDVAEIILRSSHWREALCNIRYTSTIEFDTPLRMLVRKYPDLAVVVLDNCISSNNLEVDDPNFSVVFDFEFLDDSFTRYITEAEAEIVLDKENCANEVNDSPFLRDGNVRATAQPYSSNGFIRQKNHVLAAMVNFEREELLNHPLCQKLIELKWTYLTGYTYYSQLLLFSLFLTMFTIFMLANQSPTTPAGTSANSTHSECVCLLSTKSVVELKIVTLVLAFFMSALEFFQLLRFVQLAVLSGFEVMLSLSGNKCLGYICIYSTLSALTGYTVCCHDPSTVNEPWKWQLAVAALFFGWMHLLLLIRKQPVFGIFVVMFTQVLSTFVRFALVLFLFIAAFAICFHLLLADKDQFASVSSSLMKTSIMVVGEFDFDTIFHEGPAVIHKPLVYPLYLTFVVFMSILVMNLLIGLAVDDINSVREQAQMKRLAMTVNLILDMEALLPVRFLRHAVRQHLTLQPNLATSSSAGNRQRWDWSCRHRLGLSSSQQQRSLRHYLALRDDNSDEVLEQRVVSLSGEIKRLSHRMQQLSLQLNQLSKHLQND